MKGPLKVEPYCFFIFQPLFTNNKRLGARTTCAKPFVPPFTIICNKLRVNISKLRIRAITSRVHSITIRVRAIKLRVSSNPKLRVHAIEFRVHTIELKCAGAN